MVLLVCFLNYYYYCLLYYFYFSEAAILERLLMFQCWWESQPCELWTPTNHPQRLTVSKAQEYANSSSSMLVAMYEPRATFSRELRKRNMQRYLYYTEVEELCFVPCWYTWQELRWFISSKPGLKCCCNRDWVVLAPNIAAFICKCFTTGGPHRKWMKNILFP